MLEIAEQRLRELGIELPPLQPVIGSYRLARRHADTVYLAGHVSLTPDGSDLITGKVGGALSIETARAAARSCAIHMLATVRAEIGSLDRVSAVLKVFGMVNTSPGFHDLAAVLDGTTDLLRDVFGADIATPARVAVGVAELPLGAAVETDMVVAVHPRRADHAACASGTRPSCTMNPIWSK
jgi:enamine deaminase RidA (YjgF/YER057c/UK114 family)